MLAKAKTIILIVLVQIVLVFQFLQLGNLHYHTSSDGSHIQHSHHYNKQSSDDASTPVNHKHTNGELLILQLLDVLGWDEITYEPLSGYFAYSSIHFFLYEQEYVLAVSDLCFGLRGPPIS